MVNCFTIHRAFERQAELTPENIALKHGEEQVTYKTLNAESNRLARALADYGIKTGDYVGVYLDKGIRAVTSMLAILKAGGAYIVLDRNWPRARVDEIVNETGIKLVIGAETDDESDFIRFDKASCREYKESNLELDLHPDSTAHMYFTSGTTGRSKGIIGPHKLIVQLSICMTDTFGYTQNDIFSQLSSLSFDSSMRDIFTALFCGATVCIPTKETFTDFSLLALWLKNEKVTVAQSVPSIFNRLVRAMHTLSDKPSFDVLRYYFQAGESLNISNLIKWYAICPKTELINLYGTTETMVKSYFRIQKERLPYLNAIPIGKPFANTELIIIKDNKICGIRERGTLCIRSAYMTKGYFKDENLTRQKFTQNPLHDDYSDTIYITGDEARRLPDGNVLLLGRSDNQVKIQGVRVELSELEDAVKQIKGVEEAAFVIREEDGLPRVFLFIDSDIKYSENQITSYLADKIPMAAMPSRIIFIDEIQLNSNGKLDRQHLLQYPVENELKKKDAMPNVQYYTAITDIWRDVLQCGSIHPDDNFFALGGDSLSAMRIISLIKSGLGKEIKYIDFFRNPSIQMLSDLMSGSNAVSSLPAMMLLPASDLYRASYSQERFWFLSKMDEDGISNNISIAFRIFGNIDMERYKKVLFLTMQKHEILRTCFIGMQDEAKQRVVPLDCAEIDFRYESIFNANDSEHQINEWIDSICHAPFQLDKVPLWRSGFLQCGVNDYVYVICIHHIICDGWSLNILFREIMRQYNGLIGGVNEADELPFQYKEFAAWQKGIYAEENNADRAFWLEEMRNLPHSLDFPTDFKRPAVKAFRGSCIYYTYSPEQVRRIKKFSAESETSLFVLLLTCLNILIYKYSSQQDIIVGAPMSGRNIPGVENQIGAYINVLPIRSVLDGQMPVQSLLYAIKDRLNKILEHQNYPFDKLVQDLRLPFDSSRNPVFDMVLAMQSQANADIGALGPDIAAKRMLLVSESSKFDISFIFTEEEDSITGKFEYSTDLFDKATIERIISHFNLILDLVLSETHMLIDDICITTDEEKNYVLDVFNRHSPEIPITETVISLFEKNVHKYGYRVCVSDGVNVYTFNEVNAKSNQLARHIKKNINADDKMICVYLYRSYEYIVSILAAMKAGISFVPLDTSNPPSRNQFIAQNVRARYVLTKKGLAPDYCIPIDVTDESIDLYDDCNLDSHAGLDDTAYVLYTSGSTGKSKGVKIPHKGLANYCIWASDCYIQSDKGNFAFFTSVAFDLTMTSVFLPLISGHTIIVFSEENAAQQIADVFMHKEVDIVKLTPSHLQLYMELFKSKAMPGLNKDNHAGKTLILGGENLRSSLAAQASKEIGGRIYNEYGPTEAVVGCMIRTYCDEDGVGYVPIGMPAANTRIFILDKQKRICPFGVRGEIYIERLGISSGYVDLPYETGERFTETPFSNGVSVLYRTGDIGYMTKDGEIIFDGRADDQIKISGYRIEPNEIEGVIMRYGGVLDAAVVKENDDEMPYVYIVAEREIDMIDMTAFLHSNLPAYMVPANFFRVKSIPLNTNGKRDIIQLRVDAERIIYGADKQADMTYYHELLIKECELLLGKRISMTDANFFDLGMRSLMAIQLVENLETAYGIKIPVTAIFMHHSIDRLGSYIARLMSGDALRDDSFAKGRKSDLSVYEKIRGRKNNRIN